MGKLSAAVRAHVGLSVAAATLFVGGTAAAAVAVVPTASEEPAVTSPEVTSETPATTTAAPTTEPAPVAPASVDTPAATVGAVTVPDSAPAAAEPDVPEGHQLPDLAPGQDPSGVGTIGPNGNYTAAPQPQNPGQPPVAPDPGPGAMEKLPGEDGYTG